MLTPCRFLLHGAATGTWNMALDDALLESVTQQESTRPVLRWYRWERPTLSLGYFQRCAERLPHWETVLWVRRQTGGGAILHDREWTYSVVFPANQWPRADFRQLAADVHQCVADQFAECWPHAPRAVLHPGWTVDRADEPFLCFLRRAKGDLIMGDHKILGSAQRNRQGNLLQHGSLLLRASSLTPFLPGFFDLLPNSDNIQQKCNRFVTDTELIIALSQRLADCWNLRLEPDHLFGAEVARAQETELTKYAHSSWNERR